MRVKIRVEYDVNYTGGRYQGVAQFIEIIMRKNFSYKEIDDEFRRRTGLPPVHIINHSVKNKITNLDMMEEACSRKTR